MNVKIQDIEKTLINGVNVSYRQSPFCSDHFKWFEDKEGIFFQAGAIHMGVLTADHRAFDFSQIEYHNDKEVFLYLTGTAIVLFCDIKDGKPNMNTIQVVKLHAGTKVIIQPNKGHCVPIAQDSKESVQAVVVSPKIASYHVPFDETVHAI